MLHLRVYGASSLLESIGRVLEDDGAARSVALADGVRPGHVLLTAEVMPDCVDTVLEHLDRSGVPREDVALARLDDLGPLRPGQHATSLIWVDALGQAARNARPVARYLVFMIAAGAIAGFGVIEENSILIVGAMAVSPDLLPITATCVALVGRRLRLAARAFVTLTVGLGAACAMAALLTVGLDLLDLLPSGFVVGNAALSGLTSVNSSTIGVALAAGVAGMLAVETRASAAVGVGISITTIPAAAYFGVAAGVGEMDHAWGALGVLGVNIAMLLVGGTATLLVQRRVSPPGSGRPPLDHEADHPVRGRRTHPT
jgi:uncharacterized hydrophobic protein (TIGR00271 family)